MKTCSVEYDTDDDRHPRLVCGRTARFHIRHHDRATGVWFTWWPIGLFCLCGVFRHRDNCPLKP